MVNCFLCLVNLSKKCVTFNILKSHGSLSKTKYGDLIGKLLDDQKLVITISDDNCICETCNTLLNAFDRHIYEQNVIKQIISRQVSSSYLKNKVISLSVDDEALATFDKQLDNTYQCQQCDSFKTTKVEFVAAHFKAHQCKLNEPKTIVKHEINDETVDYQEMPIEEVMLNSSCKYEVLGDENDVAAASSKTIVGHCSEPSDETTENDYGEVNKKRRISNDPATNYTTNTRLPRYLRDVMKITKTHSIDTPLCRPDNLFVIEVPQIETVGHHFTCKICLRKFEFPLKLASHLLTHKDISYSCNHCLFTVSAMECISFYLSKSEVCRGSST